MPVLDTPSPATSATFRANAERMAERVADLDERLGRAGAGGGERAIARNSARGKLPARERLALLLDPGTELLELSALAASGLYEDRVPGAGIITGIGRVAGRRCVIVVNDSSVTGGTYYPVTVTKHLRAQRIAIENHLPCIYIADSGGAFLPLQSELFADRDHGGRFFFNEARMSALGIPQLAAVMGSCTAGGAYLPAMADENVIVEGIGTVFLGGPPLVRAATGEVVTAEELGGADVHTRISGLCDHLARDDAHALELLRSMVARIPSTDRDGGADVGDDAATTPRFDAAELGGLVDAASGRVTDVRAVIARIVDGSLFDPFKERYAGSVVCGFARVGGHQVGIIAQRGALDGGGARTATHLVELCCQRRIPIVFLQDQVADSVLLETAALVQAIACAQVPRFTVVVGGRVGPFHAGLCARGLDPRQLWLWPNVTVELPTGSEPELVDAYHSTARLWDDGVIDPARTRDVLIGGIDAAACAPDGSTRFGVLRM